MRVVAENRLFSWPWSHELGSGWSAGAQSIIAGQQLFTMAVSGQRETYSSRNIVCAALRCANAVGQPPLANPQYEIKEIVVCFRKWNAAVFTLERDAMVGDVQHALGCFRYRPCHAHATAKGFFLPTAS